MRIKSTGSLVGGSIRSLATAAFMSHTGNLPGDHISILLEGKNFGKLVIRVAIDYSLLSRLEALAQRRSEAAGWATS